MIVPGLIFLSDETGDEGVRFTSSIVQRCLGSSLMKREEVGREELHDNEVAGATEDNRNGCFVRDNDINYNGVEKSAHETSQKIKFFESSNHGSAQNVEDEDDSNLPQDDSHPSLYSSLTSKGQYWRSDHLDLLLDLLNIHTRSLRMLLGLRDGVVTELSKWQSSLREREDRVKEREIRANTTQSMEDWQTQLSNRELEFFSAQDSFQTNCARQIKEMLHDISKWDERISKHFASPRSPQPERIVPRSASPRSPRTSRSEKNYRRRSDSPTSPHYNKNNRRTRRRDSPRPSATSRSTRNRRYSRSPVSP